MAIKRNVVSWIGRINVNIKMKLRGNYGNMNILWTLVNTYASTLVHSL